MRRPWWTLGFLAALLASIMATLCTAQRAVDQYMGDWQGTVTVGGKEQPVAVFMIPLGNGRYEMKCVSEFNKRVPVLYDVRGFLRNGEFRAVDAVPLDVSRVLAPTDNGVVVDVSLWSGKLVDGTLQGTIAGKIKGTFKLTKTQRTSPTLGQKPPAGAIVLFDGKSLEAWQPRSGKGKVQWRLVGGDAMEVKGGDIVTKESFGDMKLHLEFRTPYMPTSFGQARGNSGVYIQGRYEIQVLDSYGLAGLDNECGGIYKVAAPAVNMCFPPLQWQTYDITFYAPRFDAQGRKVANARITVVHNGVTIHDNLELPGITPGGISKKEAPTGPLLLQDHGNPVQYRNIWLVKLK